MRTISRSLSVVFCAGVLCLCSAAAAYCAEAQVPSAAPMLPPPMPMKEGRVSKELPPAETLTLLGIENRFTLYVPPEWRVPAAGEASLAVHFHTYDDLAAQEHVRRGLKGPLLTANLGVSSAAYGAPFENPEQFGQLLEEVQEHLKRKTGASKLAIHAVDVSMFGAGYGAVRQILKSPDCLRLIRRIVVTDSVYASYESGTQKPLAAHIDPWIAFAREAVKGGKTFVFTFSEMFPGSYAGPGECVAAIAGALDLPRNKVLEDDCAAANVPGCPLVLRVDAGNFHAWGYAGKTQAEHLNHTRYLAEIWKLLDEAGKP